MPSVFINYRRDDTGPVAEWLKSELPKLIPGASIYLDQSDTEGAENYRRRISGEISRCDVFLCLIGPRWLTIEGPSGKPRLFESDDVVFEEIDLALDHGKDVLPILVSGADMPARTKLPVKIDRLALSQALKLAQAGAAGDTNRIAARIRKLIAGRSKLVRLGDWVQTRVATPALYFALVMGGAVAVINYPHLPLIKSVDFAGAWSHARTADEKIAAIDRLENTINRLEKENQDLRQQRDEYQKLNERLQAQLVGEALPDDTKLKVTPEKKAAAGHFGCRIIPAGRLGCP